MQSRRVSLLKISALGLALVSAILFREQAAVVLIGFFAGALIAAVVVDRESAEEDETEDRVAALAEVHTPRLRALIVGSGSVGRRLASSLEASGRYVVVGFVDDDPELESAPWPHLGRKDRTAFLVRKYHIDEVILAYAPTWQQQLAEDLMTRHPGLSVKIVPSPYEALMRTSSVESLGDIALVGLIKGSTAARDVLKRGFDVAAAVSGLILAAPLMLLSALLVRLSSPGPVIFRQERVGLGGRRFTLLKFRTMVADAERETGPVLAADRGDARLTAVGKWLRLTRADELPQLWNVFRGEMSVVGPRPERPTFVAQFAERTPSYALRHRVRPGITGLAQVCGGYHTDARDKLRFDLIYVAHQSFWLDLTILARTCLVVLRHR